MTSRNICLSLVLAAFPLFLGAVDSAPESSLKRLIEGNKRYVEGKLLHPNRSQESRELSAIAQRPFAVIVGCSDSRVGPEMLFDQGIGDLFTVRVAGNVVGPLELDSVEYSVIYHQAALVLVLGHENCGAVDAVLHGTTKDIENIAVLLEPAVEASKSQKGDPIENAVKTNVIMVVDQLKKSPVLEKAESQGSIMIVGGYYNLRSGEVEILK